jgi:short-subunit dehydrogenase
MNVLGDTVLDSFVMITGALGGLGRAFVHECSRRRFNIYLTDLPPEGGNFAEEIASAYAIDVHYQACDLTDIASRENLFRMLKEENLRFWGLINVAGREHEGAFIERTRQQILHLNNLFVVANADMTHTILNLRDEGRRFMLINVCSLAAFFPMPYKATYSAAKRYVLQFSLALGEEIKTFGSATALCPGGLPTTPEIVRKNAAQGFFGKLATMDTQYVARRTVDLALKGKRVYVPGTFNLLLSKLGMLLPLPLVLRFIGKRWQNVQEKLSQPLI